MKPEGGVVPPPSSDPSLAQRLIEQLLDYTRLREGQMLPLPRHASGLAPG